MAFDRYDLDLLVYCRDPHCKRTELHGAHGKSASTIKVRRPTAPKMFTAPVAVLDDLQIVCDDCGFLWLEDATACGYCRSTRAYESVGEPTTSTSASDGLIESTFAAVGAYVPRPLVEIWQTVVNDYGQISDRGVQRALRVLIDRRQVAALTHAWLTPTARRNVRAGFYIRYDSPKLWAPGGLQDLMGVVADCAPDEAVFRG